MKESVGIGICTYNRAYRVGQLIDMVRQATPHDCRLFVADDGSADGTVEVLEEKKVLYTTGLNLGVARNKNRLLQMLQSYDFIFILEDDLIIKKEGWVELFLQAHKQSNIHYLLFCPEWYYGEQIAISEFGGVRFSHPIHDGGVCSFYTKKVIETCGGFHPDFRGYGREHCEFTDRIHRSGLAGKYRVNHIIGSEEYLSFHTNESVRRVNWLQEEKVNQQLWEELNAKKIVKVPLV